MHLEEYKMGSLSYTIHKTELHMINGLNIPSKTMKICQEDPGYIRIRLKDTVLTRLETHKDRLFVFKVEHIQKVNIHSLFI